MRIAALLSAALACSCSSKPAPGAGTDDEAPVRSTVDQVTLLGLDAGDRACSVQVRHDGGKDETLDGMHVLCDEAAGLVGQRVILTLERRRNDFTAVVAITAAP